MALSPTIPTSFVPRPSGQQRFRTDLSGAFGFLGYGVLAVAFVLALGVFIYGGLLNTNQKAKDAELKTAKDAVDTKTAQGFIRLNDRLSQSKTLLKNHVALSGLFVLLETIMPTTVRFNTLHVAIDSKNLAKVEGAGVAKSFNALASASKAFADDGHIKDAIFSSIKINKDNSVSFVLAATLDPSVTTFVP